MWQSVEVSASVMQKSIIQKSSACDTQHQNDPSLLSLLKNETACSWPFQALEERVPQSFGQRKEAEHVPQSFLCGPSRRAPWAGNVCQWGIYSLAWQQTWLGSITRSVRDHNQLNPHVSGAKSDHMGTLCGAGEFSGENNVVLWSQHVIQTLKVACFPPFCSFMTWFPATKASSPGEELWMIAPITVKRCF